MTLGGFLKHLDIPRKMKQTLPNNDIKKKKIKKCSHYSIKEINQIYLSIRCELPAKLPRVQIACSATTGWGEPNREMKPATAPALPTAFVWSDVPDAMLVSAQADSNCRSGLERYIHY